MQTLPTLPATPIVALSKVDAGSDRILAHWEDAQSSIDLFHPSYASTFGLVVRSIRLDALAQSASVEAVVRAYDESHARLAAEVGKLTLEQLNEDIEAFGRKMHRVVLLWGMTEHEIHHRGQLYTYYRLAGIEPPPLYA